MAIAQWIKDAAKRQALRNSVVICFIADGCMAHDHKFQFIGRVTEVTPYETPGMRGYWSAAIEVYKHVDHPDDWRDKDQGVIYVLVNELQELAPGLWMYTK